MHTEPQVVCKPFVHCVYSYSASRVMKSLCSHFKGGSYIHLWYVLSSPQGQAKNNSAMAVENAFYWMGGCLHTPSCRAQASAYRYAPCPGKHPGVYFSYVNGESPLPGKCPGQILNYCHGMCGRCPDKIPCSQLHMYSIVYCSYNNNYYS